MTAFSVPAVTSFSLEHFAKRGGEPHEKGLSRIAKDSFLAVFSLDFLAKWLPFVVVCRHFLA